MIEIFKMQMRHARDLCADRKGISALEYGVLAVGILAAVSAGAALIGGQITILFNKIVVWLTPT
jgi:Flp pilus assembly pilin Flp